MWLYITSHKAYKDLKINVKGSLLRPSQMGKCLAGKALTPSHYGESTANPRRTQCLLRAWALWRARRFGWADQGFRAREAAKLCHNLVAEIRDVDGREKLAAPLFKSPRAHELFCKWVPDAVRLAGCAGGPAGPAGGRAGGRA